MHLILNVSTTNYCGETVKFYMNNACILYNMRLTNASFFSFIHIMMMCQCKISFQIDWIFTKSPLKTRLPEEPQNNIKLSSTQLDFNTVKSGGEWKADSHRDGYYIKYYYTLEEFFYNIHHFTWTINRFIVFYSCTPTLFECFWCNLDIG